MIIQTGLHLLCFRTRQGPSTIRAEGSTMTTVAVQALGTGLWRSSADYAFPSRDSQMLIGNLHLHTFPRGG